jgi:hypothetical protein
MIIDDEPEQKKDRRPFEAGGRVSNVYLSLSGLSDHARLHTTGLPVHLDRFRSAVFEAARIMCPEA